MYPLESRLTSSPRSQLECVGGVAWFDVVLEVAIGGELPGVLGELGINLLTVIE